MSISTIIAEFTAEPAEFTGEAMYLAKRSILDTFGAMITGVDTSAVKMALVSSEEGNCTLIGGAGEKLTPRDAAFVNGISGHELELDDTSSSNLGHPTAAVLPTVLAVAETEGIPGRRMTEAFLIATEVECKIGRIIAKRLHERGWHCSSITGVLGAAAGAAYLLGLSKEQTINAIGIAASMASGVRENFGTLTKSVHIGKTAEDGLRAAILAKDGFTSSEIALEGKEGYIFEYSGLRDDSGSFEKIMRTMGHDWDICAPGFTIKRWPSCSSCHRPYDAFLDIASENEFTLSEVEKIEMGLSAASLRELITPDPKDGEEAKFSVGFQIGLYMAGIPNVPSNYTKEVIFRPEIQEAIKKSSMYEIDEYNHLPSEAGNGPARVTVTLKDGRVFETIRNFPVGHLTDPISDDDLKKKFMNCTVPSLGEEKAGRLYEIIMDLENVPDVRMLTALSVKN